MTQLVNVVKSRKYKKGRRITSTNQIVKAFKEYRWLWFMHKPYHPSFIANWNLITIQRAIDRKALYYAELNLTIN